MPRTPATMPGSVGGNGFARPPPCHKRIGKLAIEHRECLDIALGMPWRNTRHRKRILSQDKRAAAWRISSGPSSHFTISRFGSCCRQSIDPFSP